MVEPEQNADHAKMIVVPFHTSRDRVGTRSVEMRYGLKFFATAQSSLGGHAA